MVVRAAALAALATSATASSLGLSVDDTGSFEVRLNGKPWLSGKEVVAGGQSASAGGLKLAGAPTKSSGRDPIGQYDATTFKWVDAAGGQAVIHTSFRTYPSDPGAIVFEQSFPTELNDAPLRDPVGDSTAKCRVVTKTAVSLKSSVQGYNAFTAKAGGFDEHAGMYCDDDHRWAYTGDINETACKAKCVELNCSCYDVRTGAPTLASKTVFPGFARNPGPSDSLPCFSYHGVFPSIQAATVSTYKDEHQGGVPLVIYDKANASLPMTVFSPLNFPKAHHMASSSTMFGAGVKATVQTIPAGWSQLFLLSAGTGINDGMMAWGDRMLRFTGKQRADWYRDQTHSTIGFWTDNGGYYHYSTGENKSKTYEEVLPEVKQYHDSIGVPFGHWQFDSWFYPKDGGVNPGGGGGAVTNWTALPDVFPHGMAYIQSKIGLPTVMHNRQWSDKNDYLEHLSFKWYTSKYAIPEDPVAFFTYFFTLQKGWGLSMYEQDWMCTEYDGQEALQQNITMGDLWLKGMAAGAESSGRTVQYCMPYAHDILSASSYSAVTNARATGDYFHAAHQWAVGATSMFYWALGIIPFKDGFYSSTNPQRGGQTVGPETNPDREALMATLSCGMVGPMDGIYLLNKTRVMTTCRSDGMVLRPDRPVMTSDWVFLHADPTKFVYHAYSDVEGLGRVHYHFNDDVEAMDAGMVGLTGSEAYVVYNWYSGEVSRLSASNPLTAGYEKHIYAVVSPILPSGWAFLGEVGKYVTHSTKRVLSVESGSGLQVTVEGADGETVRVCATQTPSTSVVCKSVTFAKAGAQTVEW